MGKKRYTRQEQLMLADLLNPLIEGAKKQIIHARACLKIDDCAQHRNQLRYWENARIAYKHDLYLVNPKPRGPGRAKRIVRTTDSPAVKRKS